MHILVWDVLATWPQMSGGDLGWVEGQCRRLTSVHLSETWSHVELAQCRYQEAWALLLFLQLPVSHFHKYWMTTVGQMYWSAFKIVSLPCIFLKKAKLLGQKESAYYRIFSTVSQYPGWVYLEGIREPISSLCLYYRWAVFFLEVFANLRCKMVPHCCLVSLLMMTSEGGI